LRKATSGANKQKKGKKKNTILKTKVMSNTESTKKSGEMYEFDVSYQTLPVLLIVKSGKVLSVIKETENLRKGENIHFHLRSG
jgi:hypothetical protein